MILLFFHESRLECSVCGHTWFQSRDRLMAINEGFELVPLPEMDKDRVKLNLDEGKSPKFMGDMKLYVGNIAFASREEDIFQLFSEIGKVGDVALVRDDTGKNRGFGFVTMREKEDGEKAIAALDGQEVNGRNLAVRESSN
jgi:RNA recognition motif-containing protein